MKTLIKIIAFIFFLTVTFSAFNSPGAKSKYYAKEELTAQEIEFLNSAYKDESKDEYYFKKITEKFPDVAGFAKILSSEQNHVATLEAIYVRYEIEIPKNLDFSDIKLPSNVDEACSMALVLEKANAEMYNKFLPDIKNRYLKTVFEDLRDITTFRNIPAIEKIRISI